MYLYHETSAVFLQMLFISSKTFLNECARFLKQARNSTPYDVGNMPRTWFNPVVAAVNAVIGLLAGGVPLHKAKKKMENVQFKKNAEEYITGMRPVLTVRDDRFLGSHLARVPIPKVSESSRGDGGGGSSTHMHSSGNTFGGSGGKF